MNKLIEKLNPQSLRVPSKSYSNGVCMNLGNAKILFTTGQLPQDDMGNVVFPNDMQKQAERVFFRLKEILNEANMDFDNVVKMQIFVKDISQSSIVSNLRDVYMKNSKPVSTLVEVSGFVKDDCMLEIELTAVSFDA